MSWRRRDPVGAAGLLLFLGLAILPIGLSLVYAALYSLGLTGLLGRGLTGSHWRAVLGSRELWTSLGLSAGVALAVVAATTAAALFLALSLRERVERGPVSYLIYLPLALPGAVVAFLVFQMLTGGGLVPRVLVWLGLSGPVSLVQDRWALGIVLAHVALAVPFFTLLFADLYRSERIGELASVARSLGAGPGQCLRRVEIPLLLRAGAANLALLFILVLGSYEIPLLLGRQAPQMLSVLTLRKYALFDIAQKPQAFVVALVYTALVLVLIGILFRGERRPYGS